MALIEGQRVKSRVINTYLQSTKGDYRIQIPGAP
jgi:hypothetical protein